MIKIIETMVMEMKMVQPLSLKLKSLNQIFVIIQTGDNANKKGAGGNANKKVAFKNCAPFTKCVTRINNEHVDNAENLDNVIPMYNFIEYSDNYSDASVSFWPF